MSNKMTDEQLDRLLESYILRDPEHTFSLSAAYKQRSGINMKKYLKKSVVKSVAAGLGIALFATCFYMYGFMRAKIKYTGMMGIEDDSESSSYTGDNEFVTSSAPELSEQNLSADADNKLMIRAFAQDASQEEILRFSETDDASVEDNINYGKVRYEENMAYQYKKGEEDKPIGKFPIEQCENVGDDIIVESAPSYYVTTINFSVKGENIESIGIESANDDKLSVGVIEDEGLTPLDISEFKYQNGLLIEWKGPSKLMYNDEDIGEIRDVSEPSRSDLIELREKRRELFNDMNAEKFTEYFGDTLTVNVTYTDGSIGTYHIYITLDDDGNYILDYDE